MLTSPVNVAVALNGAALKSHAAPSDAGTGGAGAMPPSAPEPAAGTLVEPELPSSSPLTSVGAFAGTGGSRTILQDLSLNLAVLLKLSRRPDETLTALFIRIIAAIEAMPQGERLQFEARSGLKPQRITLADVAMALRRPDGVEAARLTAAIEAPRAAPGRISATVATTTYLQQGTASGHAEETLAMRAAARMSAAGQNVFSAESRLRPADSQPAPAGRLQDQMKNLFEPGDSIHLETASASHLQDDALDGSPPPEADVPAEFDADAESMAMPLAVGDGPEASAAGEPALRAAPDAADRAAEQASPPDHGAGPSRRTHVPERVALSPANLRLDPPTLDAIRGMAKAISEASAERAREDGAPAAPEGNDVPDRRRQTLLTLKGLVEVVSAMPAKAAQIMAALPAEPAPASAAPRPLPQREIALPASEMAQLPQPDGTSDERPAAEPKSPVDPMGIPTKRAAGDSDAPAGRSEVRPSSEERSLPAFEPPVPQRGDLLQHAVPFAHAQLQPARDQHDVIDEEAAAEEQHDDRPDEETDEGDDAGRRPRDEYDAIGDPPEEEDGIVITRDSTEADRAFAFYQRLRGF